MIPIPQLLAWLGGRMPAPACACGRPVDQALLEDGAQLCWPCVSRRADIAAHPDRFEAEVLAKAAVAHGDLVEIGTDIVDPEQAFLGHVRLIWGRTRLAWHWLADWPTDDRVLEDILEARSLERLWAR